ncbi:MAG: SDR family oxidoreductase [Deltaproteobacteria bacterium]|nr:SDR family oxidoreductase [Deltaproteobacteria bacterium]
MNDEVLHHSTLRRFWTVDINFNGRVAIVTGAGGGLGREYSLDLAKRGAKVIVNDLGGKLDGTGSGTSAADQVVAEIKAAGGEAVANYDSVSTMEGGRNIVKTAVDKYGKVDILINNAGILRDKSFLKMTEQDWDQVMAVHLRGAFCVTQPAAAVMKENSYGRIVLTASTSGIYGNFGQANYGAAKMAQVGFMNVIKQELAKYNVKVNTVAPNADTQMTRGIIPEEFAKKMKPKFNVPMVVYLCSEANQDSGMIFTMSAGWFARTAVVSGEGVCLGDTERDITAEEVRDQIDKIKSLDNAKPFWNSGEVYALSAPLMGL